jgi:bifunctional DNA-binding transcriptional regulator/antitoxin component of YhaV-PrlF toxin-antitoxin module
MASSLTQVDQDGALRLPDALRRQFGLKAGAYVVAEEHPEGILLRPAPPVEEYTPERIAEFLLNNACSKADYERALAEARRLGIDPATVPHEPWPGV